MASSTNDIVPAASSALGNSSLVVRQYAAKALAEAGAEALPATEQLIDALDDSDIHVREYATQAFAGIGSQAVPALAEKLQNGQSYAAVVLGRIGPTSKSEIPLLIDLLKSDDAKSESHGIHGLSGIGAASIPALMHLLHDRTLRESRPGSSYAAVRTLSLLGDPGVRALTTSLQSDDSEVRSLALWTMSDLGPQAVSAVPRIIDHLRKDSSWMVRRRAAVALLSVGSGDDATIAALHQATDDPSEHVRSAASIALAALERPR